MEAIVYALLLIFGTYGVSYALVHLDGPFNLLKKLRNVKLVDNTDLLYCVSCTSFWVAIPLTLLCGLNFVYFLGVWGAVVMLDQIVSYHVLKYNLGE